MHCKLVPVMFIQLILRTNSRVYVLINGFRYRGVLEVQPRGCTFFFMHPLAHIVHPPEKYLLRKNSQVFCLNYYASQYQTLALPRGGGHAQGGVCACLSTCLSVYLPVYLLFYLYICLSIYLSICISACLSTCLSVYLPVNLLVYLNICMSIFLSICISAYVFTCLSVYLPVYLFVYLYICLSTICHLPVYLFVW